MEALPVTDDLGLRYRYATSHIAIYFITGIMECELAAVTGALALDFTSQDVSEQAPHRAFQSN
jgi:hypothetical protein